MPRFSLDALYARLTWADVDPAWLAAHVRLARDEDLAGLGLRSRPEQTGDVTSALVTETTEGTARIVSRFDGVVAGLPLLATVLSVYGEVIAPARKVAVQPLVQDGDRVVPGQAVAELQGPSMAILQAERVFLNYLQKLSGVATETARYTEALAESATRLLDTRKTTPGWRMLEKYAVACGGGWNHRLGLFDRVMLKDNHLATLGATGGDRLTAAVHAARERHPTLPIEVEIDALDQLEPVLAAGADVVMLDNFDDAAVKQAVEQTENRAWLEASGGITQARLVSLAQRGVHFISTGATVHQSRWVDFGLDWNLQF